MNSSRKSFVCPICGEEVSPNAKACPECGACDKSGWRAASCDEDGLSLPDEEFEYDRFVENEFGNGPHRSWPQWFWSLIAAVLFIVFIVMALRW